MIGSPEPPPSLLSAEAIATMLRLAEHTPRPGCFVEVGVYKGGSAWHLAKLAREQGRVLHLFDTFTGIPEKGPLDRHDIGDFGDTTFDAVHRAIPDALYHVGEFPAKNWPSITDRIAFVHVDCDQHDVILKVIARMYWRLAGGGVMLFDDYGVLNGATAAIQSAFDIEDIIITPEGKAYVTR